MFIVTEYAALKLDKNHYKQKYKLIQVMGALYRYISGTVFTCNNIFTIPVSMKNGIVLSSCIFELTVSFV